MSHQDIILPNASLFLVHKGWSPRRQRSQKGHVEAASRNNLQSRGDKVSLDSCNIKTFTQPWAPQVEVNKSGKENEREKCSRERRCVKSNAAKAFGFVNITRPDRPLDPRVRKFVMNHVKTGIERGPNIQMTTKLKSTTCYSDPRHMDATTENESRSVEENFKMSVKLGPTVSGASSPLYGSTASSLLTGPRSELLLNYCVFLNVHLMAPYYIYPANLQLDLYEVAPSWYPLEAHLAYNPVREGWFPLAIQDELLFRSILFSSASHLCRKSGNRNLEEVTSLVLPIFHHLKKRLQANPVPCDTTISIVSCLAMVEVVLHLLCIKLIPGRATNMH